MGYPPGGDRYVQTAPTLGYHDAYTKWGTNGLNSTRRAEYAGLVSRDRGAGYAGTFVDDANFAGGNIPGSRAELANLIEACRSALGPSGILEINAQYHDIWPLMKAHDPDVERALAATTQVDKEFGVTPTSGINSASDYAEFFAYVDTLHAKGIHLDLSSVEPGDEYGLATYFLLTDGQDLDGTTTPAGQAWWRGYELDLGEATSAREHAGSVYKRSYAQGLVYAVEPGGSTQTIKFGPHHTIAGAAISEATLSARQGIVLLP